jgi:uncharacterized protein YjbI with pentapeptide repeats
MKTLIKINSIFGKLLFEYECEENSIKKTLEQAVKLKTDLSSVNLESANLENANLRYVNLRYVNLENANLPIFCKWSNIKW